MASDLEVILFSAASHSVANCFSESCESVYDKATRTTSSANSRDGSPKPRNAVLVNYEQIPWKRALTEANSHQNQGDQLPATHIRLTLFGWRDCLSIHSGLLTYPSVVSLLQVHNPRGLVGWSPMHPEESKELVHCCTARVKNPHFSSPIWGSTIDWPILTLQHTGEDFTPEAEEGDATPVELPPMCQPGQPGQENLQVTTT